MSSPDPFSARFDSIVVKSTNAPSVEAIDSALAAVTAGGFELLDNAGGRFAIDPQLGIISVANDAVLARDAGQIHSVRMRVTEPSGARYEMDMALKITGRVPQMIGAEDFGAIATLAADVAPAPPVEVTLPPTPFVRYAATQLSGAAAKLGSERAVYGTLLGADLSRSTGARIELRLRDTPPAPARANAAWPL